jgi:hypothetical protein
MYMVTRAASAFIASLAWPSRSRGRLGGFGPVVYGVYPIWVKPENIRSAQERDVAS